MNEITRDNIGEWIGKEVDVSYGGVNWEKAILIGYDTIDSLFIVRTARNRNYFRIKHNYCRIEDKP